MKDQGRKAEADKIYFKLSIVERKPTKELKVI